MHTIIVSVSNACRKPPPKFRHPHMVPLSRGRARTRWPAVESNGAVDTVPHPVHKNLPPRATGAAIPLTGRGGPGGPSPQDVP